MDVDKPPDIKIFPSIHLLNIHHKLSFDLSDFVFRALVASRAINNEIPMFMHKRKVRFDRHAMAKHIRRY